MWPLSYPTEDSQQYAHRPSQFKIAGTPLIPARGYQTAGGHFPEQIERMMVYQEIGSNETSRSKKNVLEYWSKSLVSLCVSVDK